MIKWEYKEISTKNEADYEIGKPVKKIVLWIDGQPQGKTSGNFLSKTSYPDFYLVLNQLGEDGWELVSVEDRGRFSEYIFKRPRS